MKNYLNLSKITTLLSVLMLLFMMSCKKNEGGPEFKEPRALEANLLESAELFASALKERGSDQTFEIEDIKRKDATIQVKVKGGGSEESFQFIWDGRIQESYPMGIMLVLKYDNQNGDFDKNKEFLINVNLQKILGDVGDTKDFHFSVLNGSKKQQKNLNPDGTISDE